MNVIEKHIAQLRGDGVADKMVLATEILHRVEEVNDQREKKKILVRLFRALPKHAEFLSQFKAGLDIILMMSDDTERRHALFDTLKELPTSDIFSPLRIKLIRSSLDAATEISDARHRKSALLRLASSTPEIPEAIPLYKRLMEEAVDAASKVENRFVRKYSLVDIANELPDTAQFTALRLHSLTLAMGLDRETVHGSSYLIEIADELPKSSDYAFYRKYSLLGIATGLPVGGDFLELYKKAIRVAIAATDFIEEPSYKKYALLYIGREIYEIKEMGEIYIEVMEKSLDAALLIKDSLVRKFALIDILKEMPKRDDLYPLITRIMEEILQFFAVRRRMEGVDMIDVLDFLIVAEERKLSETKKKRFTKERYAKLFARELDKFGGLLNDIRLLEILRPYTHVWIQPKELRTAVKKIVEHLEQLSKAYHGREIELPCLQRDIFTGVSEPAAERQPSLLSDDILSIDLGATNTVVMKRRGAAMPEFVELPPLSIYYGDTCTIPSAITPGTEEIGAKAYNHEFVTNFKGMLLEGRQDGERYMSAYLGILTRSLKKKLKPSQWYNIRSSSLADKVYMTAPVGFYDYRNVIGNIVRKTMKGTVVEFLEEPLAAAIGYQVAEISDKIIMIIDFGGSTMDVMILRLNSREVHVVSKPDRAKMLGGHNIDAWLRDYLYDKYRRGGDNRWSHHSVKKAEEIKISLSDRNSVEYDWYDGLITVTRGEIENILLKHGFYKTIDRVVSNIMRKAEKVGITRERIEAVLLTGGSSQIPSFKEKIESVFPELRVKNAIYDHSPLSAVATGAALYQTNGIMDRHLGFAYALRYTTKNRQEPHLYEIIFEKGEPFPFEKTFLVKPAKTLSGQKDIYLELFSVPESLITRRWERDKNGEFIKQVLNYTENMALRGFGLITIPFDKGLDSLEITFVVDSGGGLSIRHINGQEIETGIKLQ